MFAEDDVRVYTFGDYRLNVSKWTLSNKGVPVKLTQKSFELLHFLIQNEGKVIEKEQCFDAVWGENIVDESNLTQHIYRIRKILKGNKDGVIIETIPKRGYRFIGKVEKCIDYTEQVNGLPPKSPHITLDSEIETPSVIISPSFYSQIKTSYLATSLAFLLLSFIAFQFYFSSQKVFLGDIKQNQSVAVLPFKQIGDSSDKLLSVGMADTIISKIGNLDEIVVLPIEAVSSYTKEATEQLDQNLFETGEKLGVDILLTGTIQKENNSVRFNVKLYHVKTQRYLCAIKYDKVAADTFNLQDMIANQVLQKFSNDLQAHKDAENKKTDKPVLN